MKTPLEIISHITTTPNYTAATIKELMKRLQQNEKGFALLMNVTPTTVRLWTSGALKPCGQSQRLMQIYDACPEILSYIITKEENYI